MARTPELHETSVAAVGSSAEAPAVSDTRTETPAETPAENSASSDAVAPPVPLIRMVSVTLKEAALDSPSFRAYVTNSSDQIERIEQWIESTVRVLRKLPQQISELSEITGSLSEHFPVDFFDMGILDQDYTAVGLRHSSGATKTLYRELFGILAPDDAAVVVPLVALTRNEFRFFKETRKLFEAAQTRYDMQLSRYAAQPKNKEPSALREDAFRLAELRHTYLRLSLDLCISVSDLQHALDACVSRMLSQFWLRPVVGVFAERFPDIRACISTMKKIAAWNDAMAASSASVRADMLAARHQVELSAQTRSAPSRALADYAPDTVARAVATAAAEPPESFREKHGWLFMKTHVGKPAHAVWVRRWAFIRAGVFGLLVLAPSAISVQETDKIGVLLCSAEPASDEDRRHCFVVKTMDASIVFQAETARDVAVWLRCFAEEKRRVVADGAAVTAHGFSRHPPPLPEFADTVHSSADAELTSVADGTPPSALSAILGSGTIREAQRRVQPFQFQLSEDVAAASVAVASPGVAATVRAVAMSAPLGTGMSRVAVLAPLVLRPGAVPNAVTANFWGSVNWGLVYALGGPMDSGQMPKHAVAQLLPAINGGGAAGGAAGVGASGTVGSSAIDQIYTARYPSYYPPRLWPVDVQMKALFESLVDGGPGSAPEYAVLSFRGLWAPNPKQELAAVCFATMTHLYIYMNTSGFVSLVKKPLVDVVAVEGFEEETWDLLKLYDIRGVVLRCRLFVDSGREAQRVLSQLVANSVAQPRLELPEMLEVIERRRPGPELPDGGGWHSREKEKPNAGKITNGDVHNTNGKSATVTSVSSSVPKTDFSDSMEQMAHTQTYEVPAKALFHLLFGDKSPVLQTALIGDTRAAFAQTPWRPGSDGSLQREIGYELVSVPKVGTEVRLGTTRSVQKLESVVDNSIYVVKQRQIPWQLPLGAQSEATTRYVITALGKLRCQLQIWHHVGFSGGALSLVDGLIHKLLLRLLQKEAVRLATVAQRYVARLGSHGRTLRAIRYFGDVGADTSEEPLESTEKAGPAPSVLAAGPAFVLTQRSAVRIAAEFAVGWAASVFSAVLFVAVGSGKAILRFVQARMLLIVALVASVALNAYLGSVVANQQIKGRNLIRAAEKFGSVAPGTLNRAIHTSDVHEFLRQSRNRSTPLGDAEKDSLCRARYREESFVTLEAYSDGFLANSEADLGYAADPAARAVAQQLRTTYHELGVTRNRLLTELATLDRLEEELVWGEWRNWLLAEVHRCNAVRAGLVAAVKRRRAEKESQERKKSGFEAAEGPEEPSLAELLTEAAEIFPGSATLFAYCGSCDGDYVDLVAQLV